ncbi:hypothetical protein D3C75_1154890 [compost metagenome]|jgi:transposase
MTNEQFDTLAVLINATGGVSDQGAKIVLVDGKPVKEAAEELGCTIQTIYKSVKRFKSALELAKAVAR